MNEKELEIARQYLLAINGYVCNRCKKDISTLNSVVQIDHINGNYYDHRLENLQQLCSSCNNLRKAEVSSQNIVFERPLTYEQHTSRFSPTKLYEWADERIYKFFHVCLFDVLSDGCKYAGCKQTAGKRYLELEMGSETGKYRYENFKCDSENCTGVHLFQRSASVEKLSPASPDVPQKFMLVMKDDQKPRDIVDKTLDKTILHQSLMVPTSFEMEAWEKFNLQKHVNESDFKQSKLSFQKIQQVTHK